jgi:hypothetical protein
MLRRPNGTSLGTRIGTNFAACMQVDYKRSALPRDWPPDICIRDTIDLVLPMLTRVLRFRACVSIFRLGGNYPP